MRVKPAEIGSTIRIHDHDHQVAASCGGQKGEWYCATHNQSFVNQFEKDCHISKGSHVLVWLCPAHGPEGP